MRIHGIHLQGLRSPRSELRLTLDSGYNAVVAHDADESAAFAALLRALLFPATDLGSWEQWVDAEASDPARAGLAFSLGARAYRLILDFPNERMLLGRYEKSSDSYERVSTDPDEIAAHMTSAGLPTREQFLALYWCAEGALASPVRRDPREGRSAGPSEREQLEQRLRAAQDAVRSVAELEPRLRDLETRRERLLELERQHKRVEQELEHSAPLVDALEDLDERMRRYRELVEKREAEQSAVERTRQDLLSERSQLRVVPPAQRSWMLLGVVLGAAGALASGVVHLGFTAAAVIGVGMAIYALIVSRTARRRIGNIEARLAALRVRERAMERHFESEGAPVRGLLRSLELESPEELDAAAARVRSLLDALERDKRELADARRAFPEESDAELAELRSRVDEARGESELDEIQAELDRLDDEEPPTQPQLAPRAPRHPVDAFAAAERASAAWADLPLEELRQRFAAVLPLYLRSLTGGRALHAHRSEEGWLIRTQRGGGDVPFRELGERLQADTAVALRLALLESTSLLRAFPLLLATDEIPLEADGDGALARALKRLSSVTQVILIAQASQPWAGRGARIHEL